MNNKENDFCRTCGAKRKNETDNVCRECGNRYPLSLTFNTNEPLTVAKFLEEQEKKQETETIPQEKTREKKNKFSFKWLIIILLALLLPGGSIVGFLYVKEQTSAVNFAKEVVSILESNNTSKLNSTLNPTNINNDVASDTIKKLVKDLSEDKEVQSKVIESLLSQGKALEEGREVQSFVLEIQPLSKKKWFLFPQYGLVFKPIEIAVRVPEGVELEVNEEQVKPSEKGVATVKLSVAGSQHFSVKSSEGEEESWSLYIWDNSKEDVLEVEDDINNRIIAFSNNNEEEEDASQTASASTDESSSEDESSSTNTTSSQGTTTGNSPSSNATGGDISFSDSEVEQIVLKIRKEYNHINDNQGSFKKSQHYVNDDGEINYTKYTDTNGIMRKMVVDSTSVNGRKKTTEYYFWGNGDFFFSFSTFEGEENRYYFQNNRMIRWINPWKVTINFETGQNSNTYLAEESAMLNSASYMYEVAKKF